MGRVILILVLGAVLLSLWARSTSKRKSKPEENGKTGEKRPEDEPTELNKHPERLEQNLDPTDDA
jgi:hypothetical protein